MAFRCFPKSLLTVTWYPNFYNLRPPGIVMQPGQDSVDFLYSVLHQSRFRVRVALLPQSPGIVLRFSVCLSGEPNPMSLVRVCPWKKLLMRNAICMIMWINYSELNEHSNHNREEDDHPWEMTGLLRPLPTEISGGWWIVSVQRFSVKSMWNRSSSEQLMYVQEEECGKLIKCTKFWAEFLNKSTANYSHLLNRFGILQNVSPVLLLPGSEDAVSSVKSGRWNFLIILVLL